MVMKDAKDLTLWVNPAFTRRTGFTLQELASQAPDGRSHRTLVLSADAMPDQVQRALQAGFHDHLAKPLVFSQLRRRSRTWLSDPQTPH